MALPIFYPFKTRVINAATVSSSGTALVPVPARAKLMGGYICTNGAASNAVSGGGVWDLEWSGATSTSTPAVITGGTSAIASTTSTAIQSIAIPLTSPIFFVNAGDVLSIVGSSTPGFSVSLVLQEF